MGKYVADTKDLREFISDRLEEHINEISVLCADGGLTFKNADDKNCLMTLQSNLTHSLRTLSQAKIWNATHDKLRRGGTEELGPQLCSQSEVIAIIWDQLREKFNALLNRYVDDYCDKLESDQLPIDSLVRKWPTAHEAFKSFVSSLLPFLEYIHINYPLIVKDIPDGLSTLDSYELYFITLIKTKLKSRFLLFLETYTFWCLNGRISEHDIARTESPMLLTYKYKLELGQVSFKEFYCETVYKFTQSEVHVKIDLNYLAHLTRYLTRNALVTGSISMALLDTSNGIILQNTFLVSETTFILLKLYKDNIPLSFNADTSENDYHIGDQIEVLIKAYRTTGRESRLADIYLSLVRSTLESITVEKRNLNNQFSEMCRVIIIMERMKSLKLIARVEINRAFGGTFKLLSSYVKFCDSLIRKFNKEAISNPERNLEYEIKNSLLLQVPALLKLDSTFLIQYCQSLFRRAILFGPIIYETLTSPRFLEFHLLSLFEKRYRNSSSYQYLIQLRCEILKSSKLALDFQSQLKSEMKVNFFLFNRNHVPSAFLNGNTEPLILPELLEGTWKKFRYFYEKKDQRGENKSINLIYKLQYCEVETPYSLRNGRRLILDLTVPQTSVLSLFNDTDMLTYSLIAKATNLNDTMLSEILHSFTDIGLLEVEKGNYLLNQTFHPDERRVKDGKLRIILNESVKTGPKSSELNIHASQHKEGNRSHWTQELLKASIVRSLKGNNEGLEYDVLFGRVESQINGISIGEFKEALEKTIVDKCITKKNNFYVY